MFNVHLFVFAALRHKKFFEILYSFKVAPVHSDAGNTWERPEGLFHSEARINKRNDVTGEIS